MAKKITPETVAAMVSRYKELGTYAAVAKEFGISAATASRYIKEQNSVRKFASYSGPQPTSPRNVFFFSTLTEAEAASLEEWYDEFFPH